MWIFLLKELPIYVFLREEKCLNLRHLASLLALQNADVKSN